MDKEITTDEAILQLQSLLDVCLDDSVSIIIKPTEMSVKAFGKEYAVANARFEGQKLKFQEQLLKQSQKH